MIDLDLNEQIEKTLSLIRHNKVYENLEEIDVEAYNMAEDLIETLRSKLEDAEKHHDQWLSMWEKEQTENEELKIENDMLKADLIHLAYVGELQLDSLEEYMLHKSSGNSAEYAQRSILTDLQLRKVIEHTKGKIQ